jgi:hypothetical protein
MKINLWIEPKDEKQFREDLRKFLNDHAKNCEETIVIDGKAVVQETSEYSKAWYYKIEKEKQ